MVQVAYIGLGNIGFIIASHIADKLESSGEQPLLIYNCSIDKAEKLKATGKHVKIATSLEEVTREADIIFSCLFNDESVKEILGKKLIESGDLKDGAILVDQTTISPETATYLSNLVSTINDTSSKKVTYLASPVMGAPPRARQKLLISLLSGPKEGREKILPYIENVIGKLVIQVSDDQSASSKLKLCGNFLIFGLIELVSQSLTLGEGSGIGQEPVKALIDGLFANTPFVDYSNRMVNETYKDSILFSISGALKDTNFILDLGEKSNVDLPITKIFKENMTTLEQKHPDLDVSAIVGVQREAAGLNFNLKK
ncbi:unnamed protein product [Cunninghamella blakesleeana]